MDICTAKAKFSDPAVSHDAEYCTALCCAKKAAEIVLMNSITPLQIPKNLCVERERSGTKVVVVVSAGFSTVSATLLDSHSHKGLL